jgi:hypothetical protein
MLQQNQEEFPIKMIIKTKLMPVKTNQVTKTNLIMAHKTTRQKETIQTDMEDIDIPKNVIINFIIFICHYKYYYIYL